jgi:hypothetical protein
MSELMLIFNNLQVFISIKIDYYCALGFRFRKYFFDRITGLTGRGLSGRAG